MTVCQIAADSKKMLKMLKKQYTIYGESKDHIAYVEILIS